jgi:DnaJ like chaperone protein
MILEVLVGFWGRVVGGAVGGVLGGPFGVVMGVGIGSMFDGKDTSRPGAAQSRNFQGGDFGATVEPYDDPDGRYFIVMAPLPDGTGLRARLLTQNGGSYIRSRAESMADADGDFVSGATFTGGFAGVYIPAGAIARTEGVHDIVLELTAYRTFGESFEAIGCQRFNGELKAAATWSEAVHWRPMIGLCMMVARADGKLLAEEVRAIRKILEEGLKIPADEQAEIRRLMKQEPSGTIDEIVCWMRYRFPDVPLDALLSALCDVSKADGDVAASEVEIIRQVAITYGVRAEDWPALAEMLELQPSADVRLEHLCLLGLQRGASKADVKTAYRTKVKQYHPDRVSNLAPEFQELATRKTIGLRVAYEELLTSFD